MAIKNLDLDPDAPKKPGSTFSEYGSATMIYGNSRSQKTLSPGIDSQPGEIDCVESIPGLLNVYKFGALAHTVNHLLNLASLEVSNKLTDFSASQLDMTKCHGTDHWLLRH